MLDYIVNDLSRPDKFFSLGEVWFVLAFQESPGLR